MKVPLLFFFDNLLEGAYSISLQLTLLLLIFELKEERINVLSQSCLNLFELQVVLLDFHQSIGCSCMLSLKFFKFAEKRYNFVLFDLQLAFHFVSLSACFSIIILEHPDEV